MAQCHRTKEGKSHCSYKHTKPAQCQDYECNQWNCDNPDGNTKEMSQCSGAEDNKGQQPKEEYQFKNIHG